MISKSVIFLGCLALSVLFASPAMSGPHRGSRAGFTSHRMAGGTSYMSHAYPRYGNTWRSGFDWHHRHHGGTSFVFYGGFPYYGYYPYSYPYGYLYWDSYPYGYYSYYGQPRYADDDSLVADVQQALAEQGYYHGAIDGVVGPRTRSAIRAYERRQGLIVDGIIDRQFLANLGLR